MQFRDTQRLFERRAAPLGSMSRFLRGLHLDGPLLAGLLLLAALGLFVLYSAVGDHFELWRRQCVRFGIALGVLVVTAQVPPDLMRRWAPWAYAAGLGLLVLVLAIGDVSQGAQRWLDLGVRFQPSEIMKLAVPMIGACYLHDRQLPPSAGSLLAVAALIAVPASLIAVQPDL
ncbi:MAG TPA: FtsW/RodA/SpoVE family cell cycle protein, partial [Burkholderiaceae bacterium]|nr:FtsW/RodA/SpoVE family cell cycle protein [Burkholderiaceae bacterium]